jgi:hypothetical protein
MLLFAFFAFVVFNACILTFTTSIGFVVAVAHATETPDMHTFGTSARSTIIKSLFFNHPFQSFARAQSYRFLEQKSERWKIQTKKQEKE